MLSPASLHSPHLPACITSAIMAEFIFHHIQIKVLHAMGAMVCEQRRYEGSVQHLQVPLPRSTEALRWLQGQPQSPRQLMPRIYFSPRRSSAPDTDGGAAASAAAAGSGAVAGVGSAWTWQVCGFMHREQLQMQTCKGPLLTMHISNLPLLAYKPSWSVPVPLPCCVRLPRTGAKLSDRQANSLTQASEHALNGAGRARAGANRRGHAMY
jgi:hypothetical protein